MQEPADQWILVIENDEVVRDLTTEILQSGGYDVRTAYEGTEALTVLDLVDRKPECVILDYAMPGMGGYETLTNLRATYPELPVLLISGSLRAEIEDRFLTNRPDDFLKKPYGASELLFRVGVLTYPGRADAEAV